jgi:hypothetical protein
MPSRNQIQYKWSFKLSRLIVFTLKKMPRGIAKAPQVVSPAGVITKESMASHILDARKSIEMLETMPKDKFFHHPYFGDLKLKEAIKMLGIYTEHHLKIIQDI